MCPNFKCLDALFGEKPNVRSVYIYDSSQVDELVELAEQDHPDYVPHDEECNGTSISLKDSRNKAAKRNLGLPSDTDPPSSAKKADFSSTYAESSQANLAISKKTLNMGKSLKDREVHVMENRLDLEKRKHQENVILPDKRLKLEKEKLDLEEKRIKTDFLKKLR